MTTKKRTRGKPARRPAKRTKKTNASPNTRMNAFPNTGSEAIPPGATAAAAERETTMGAEEGLGTNKPYHAAGDPGSPEESYEAVDGNEPLADMPLTDEELDPLEKGPPYAGPAGGAVGGTPAQRRSTGGHIRHGLKPGGVHRGDSSVGADPDRSS